MIWRSSPTRTIVAVVLALISLPAIAAKAMMPSPEQVAGATTVSAEQAKALFDSGATFIDVRDYLNRKHGYIPGALFMETLDEFKKDRLAESVKQDENLVIYCNGIMCHRSYTASALAVSWGYKHVYYFRGGFPEWQEKGYPVK